MTGICGLLHIDDRPVDAEHLARMVNTMLHRGPDGQQTWHAGPVGFGHLALHTTPESERESLPRSSGKLAITADARLDNRAELIARLGLDAPQAALTDSALLLEAYRRWGTDCTPHLLGDFAFAIWDAANHTLFCARDHVGVKPFYYHQAGTNFAFATEIKALHALPFVPRHINERRIADFMVKYVNDTEITFYETILRLPPAHTLTVRKGQITLRRYWTPADAPDVRLPTDEAYGEAFREIFLEAVSCRMRSPHLVGSSLSGGLDSSSVVAAARHILQRAGGGPLPVYSAVFPDVPESDERTYIQYIVNQGGVTPHEIRADRLTTFPEADRPFFHLEEPYQAANLFLTWAVYEHAHQDGLRLVLDGLDGDSALSHGFGYLAELAQQGRWDDYNAQVQTIREVWKVERPAKGLHRSYAIPSLTFHARGLRWWRIPGTLSALSQITGESRRNLFMEYAVRRALPHTLRAQWRRMMHRTPMVLTGPFISPDFVERMTPHLQQRFEENMLQPPIRSARDQHERRITFGLIPWALELRNRAAAASQVEPLHPFFDRRVIDFAIGMPGEPKLRGGLSRNVLRWAMQGLLPSEIQWRRDKADLGHNFDHVFRNADAQAWYAEYFAPPLTQFAAETYYERHFQQVLQGETDCFDAWWVLLLGKWLKNTNLLT